MALTPSCSSRWKAARPGAAIRSSACPAGARYAINGHTLRCSDFGRELSVEELDDPLARIEEIRSQYRVPDLDELPVFSGGLVGYFGYETVELLEPRLAGRTSATRSAAMTSCCCSPKKWRCSMPWKGACG